MTEMTVAEGRGVMQFVHVVLLLVDAQQALVQREGLTHREVTLASGVVGEGVRRRGGLVALWDPQHTLSRACAHPVLLQMWCQKVGCW